MRVSLSSGETPIRAQGRDVFSCDDFDYLDGGISVGVV
jgi:hypothetical protein